MLLIALVNASSDDEREGTEARDFCREITLPIHTLTPFLASACQEVRAYFVFCNLRCCLTQILSDSRHLLRSCVQQGSRAWRSGWLRLDLWEILYTASRLAARVSFDTLLSKFQYCTLSTTLVRIHGSRSEKLAPEQHGLAGDFLKSGALDFITFALQEAVRVW
jgi:hypothetical protein